MANYEDLRGASGQQIYYRAERFAPRHLFGDQGPETYVDGVQHKLLNLSLSGLATLDRSHSHTEQSVGETVPVCMRIDNTPLHEGYGRVVRVEQTPAGAKLAIRLTDKCLDITRLSHQYREYNLKRALHQDRLENLERADPGYRLLCTDALHLLRAHAAILLDWEEKNTDRRQDSRYGCDFLDLAAQQILPEWRDLSERANDFIDQIIDDPRALEPAKRFTEMVLTPEMMAGPIWRRSYEKPLGYPGDYQVMDYVYTWQDQGETLYGQLIHRLGLDSLDCVAERMSMVQQIIGQEMIGKNGEGPVNITNLACGSAQEVVNCLGPGRLLRPVSFTLIDQDHDALAYAYERAFPHTIRFTGQVKLHCLHSSFMELMKGGVIAKSLPPQDMIYSVGLFDYLKTRRAENLLTTLFESLAPGGLLVIGNLKEGRRMGRWAAEMICDWPMIYRTEKQMTDLTKKIQPESMQILTDRTDKVYLLLLRKAR